MARPSQGAAHALGSGADAHPAQTVGLCRAEIKQQTALWPNKKVFEILGLLREYDAKSKGLNSGGASDGELLRELLLKIFLL